MPKILTLPLFAVALVVSAVAAAADPTPHQIYEALQNGQLVQAQQMVNQVLQDHPDNAKAHYIAAEVDARSGDLNAGRQQLAKAREIDPQLAFADSHSVSELTAQLAGRTLAPGVVPQALVQPHRSAVPWGLILILGAGALLLWNLFRRRQQQATYYQAGSPGYGTPSGGPGLQSGYGYGAPYPPPAGGMGSGIVGGLATGLAVGAGVAAGEALVDHMIDGHEHGGGFIPSAGAAELPDRSVNQDLGGNDFGVSDGGGWGNDDSGGSDFGGGGDSWT